MKHDPRLTPARPDLAAAYLEGAVPAPRYAAGQPMHVAVECAGLRRAPSPEAALDTQALHGEDVTVYDFEGEWAWVQLAGDSYVGYLPRHALAEGEAKATHRVRASRSFTYSRPDIKAAVLAAVPLGGMVRLVGIDDAFAELAGGGFVVAHHLIRREETARDYVAVAEKFLNAPYLWGGKSWLGLDCSGLVQLALAQSGVAAPRDTDLQQQGLGMPLPLDAAAGSLKRGDLVFWKGHVGLMRDTVTLLHANAHHMCVASEPLDEARSRIRDKGAGEIEAIRRLRA